MLAILLTAALPFYLLSVSGSGMWTKSWILFRASNQLLAGLTLLAITVWLHRARRRIAFTLLPMIFVLGVTLTALGRLTYANLKSSRGFDLELVNGVAALALVAFALYLAATALVRIRGERRPTAPA